MILYIKHMVSLRCKYFVIKELKKLNINYVNIELGSVNIIGNISDYQKIKLFSKLAKVGLIVIDNKNEILINKIKSLIINLIYRRDDVLKINYSDHISNNLELNYTYLSNVFSRSTGQTIQQFIICNKIERVKELIKYNDLNFTEIAYKLHYNSLAHLSYQFKKHTGKTLSLYKTNNKIKTCNI